MWQLDTPSRIFRAIGSEHTIQIHLERLSCNFHVGFQYYPTKARKNVQFHYSYIHPYKRETKRHAVHGRGEGLARSLCGIQSEISTMQQSRGRLMSNLGWSQAGQNGKVEHLMSSKNTTVAFSYHLTSHPDHLPLHQ